jgi:hypothetical protein
MARSDRMGDVGGTDHNWKNAADRLFRMRSGAWKNKGSAASTCKVQVHRPGEMDFRI